MKNRSMDINVVKIDLARSTVSRQDASHEGRRFLGGRGVNHLLLLQELAPGIDPLGADNAVVFGAGPLVGTDYPGANRLNIASLSPISRGLGSSSAGGGFSIALRSNGVDHLLLAGRADRPVYITVDQSKIKIRDAAHLWEQTTRETCRRIREELGDENVQIACIGPAGEKRALNACVMLTEGRAAGRCGLGAVLGSKNVKAIAVKGQGRKFPCESGFDEQVNHAINTISGSRVLQSLMQTGTVAYGTTEGDPHRLVPHKNFQFTEPVRRFRLADFEQYHIGGSHVPGCPFSCTQRYAVQDGKYRGTVVEKLEGNSRGNFGERLAIDDAAAVLKAHELCQLLGLDVDNTSGAIAWAFECYQRGLLTSRDTDGLELNWGNDDAVIALVKMCGHREGFGDLLADGCRRAAEKLGRGSDAFCVHVKGQALQETLRAYKGWALGIVVSERAGGHTRGAPCTEFGAVGADPDAKLWSLEASERLFGFPNAGDPTSYEHKAELVAYYERFHAVLDSIGLCYFMSNWIDPQLLSPDDIATALSEVYDRRITTEDMMHAGERIVCLGRLFNQIHAGFCRNDDYPPARLMDEPVETGPYQGERLARDDWDRMLDAYYRIHNWDIDTGRVPDSTLTELGIGAITPQSTDSSNCDEDRL